MSALAWGRPLADVVLATLLVLVLRRLGRDPALAWRERESALRAIFDDVGVQLLDWFVIAGGYASSLAELTDARPLWRGSG